MNHLPFAPQTTRVAMALAAALLLAPAAQAAVVYALGGNGTTLVSFDSASPGSAATVGAISGAASALNGIDFRPADGMLYGYSNTTGGIYRINPSTGATTLVSVSSASTTSALLGVDFNPVPDRLRVVTTNLENRRINVDTGAAISDGALAYAAGDANANARPNIIEAAYTNSDRNPATGTTLYYIDYVLNTLVSTANPNGGVLNTVGALGLDIGEHTGFDILTDAAGLNTAFATFDVSGVQGFYTINLGTGAATLVGRISPNIGSLVSLAVAPVPEPGSLPLVAAAGAALWLRRRRTA